MAGVLVGGALLSASLQVLFDRLASPEFVNFFRRRKFDDRLLKKLRRTLLSIELVLDDAEAKQLTNEKVKLWLFDLQDAIYEADDLVDRINTEALRFKVQTESGSCTSHQVRDPITISTIFDEDIQSEIEKMIETLEDFVKFKDVLGLKEGVVGGNSSHKLIGRATSSLVDESAVYGREKEQEEIIKLLLSDDQSGNDIGVVAIVGMGGIGKTTLAQLVYNDGRVGENFDIKAWVCVSEEFDIIKVTKKMLVEVSGVSSDKNELNTLQVDLMEKLNKNKFLLVLDDVWNESYNDWDLLSRPLKVGARGSKVIVTTRNESVASILRTFPVRKLDLLLFEDCWSLFVKHAFGNGDLSSNPDLEAPAKEIVRNCKGLPLAVKTLGGMLRCKRDVEEWDGVLKSEIWHLSEGLNCVLPALWLSYRCLPSHLKRCFGYCSLFPKDYEFQKKKLVNLWIAQNFVMPSGKKPIKEVNSSTMPCFSSPLLTAKHSRTARQSRVCESTQSLRSHSSGCPSPVIQR